MDIEEVLQGNIEKDNEPSNSESIETGHFLLGTNALFEASVPHEKLYKTWYYDKHQAHNPQNGQVHFHIYQENSEQPKFSINIDGSFHDGRCLVMDLYPKVCYKH